MTAQIVDYYKSSLPAWVINSGQINKHLVLGVDVISTKPTERHNVLGIHRVFFKESPCLFKFVKERKRSLDPTATGVLVLVVPGRDLLSPFLIFSSKRWSNEQYELCCQSNFHVLAETPKDKRVFYVRQLLSTQP